jgi:prevent-host-death family protein
MISAGIKELKNNLSRFISLVKGGEDVLITERGRIVARIIREDRTHISMRKALSPLAEKGMVALPSQSIEKEVADPIEVPGKLTSEIIIEDRR